MTTRHSLSRTGRKELYLEILITLINLSPSPNENSPPPENTWAATRQISNAHNVSIYKARLLLLELVNQGLVIVTDGPVNNSLRWYPDREAIFLRKHE